MKVLAGEPPPGCQECGLSFADLDKRAAGGNISMSIVPKDGIYQVICELCAEKYFPKRADLLAGTDFGRQIGL